MNHLRPWGASPGDMEAARQDAIASLTSAGILGYAVGSMVALMTLLVRRTPRNLRGYGSILLFLALLGATSPLLRIRGVLGYAVVHLRAGFGSNAPDRATIGAPIGVLVGAVVGLLLAESLSRIVLRRADIRDGVRCY